MSKFIGDFAAGDTIDFKFTTYRPSTGAPFTLAGTPVVSVYKANSTTESTAGVTLTTDFDSRTGLNHVRITTSSDGTFYSNTDQFEVVITTGTVDSVSVVGACVGRFTLAAQTNKALTSSVTVGTNNDKTGYSLTQSFPTNFSSLAITAGGAVTAGTVSDKTGYSLTQSFPTNFSSLSITAGGAVTAGTVSDKTGYSLSTGSITTATFGAGAIDANALATDAVNEIADGVWDEATSGHTTAGTYGGRILRATNSNVEVQVTGSNHVAADVHEFQPAVITSGDFAAGAINANALATDAVNEIADGVWDEVLSGHLTAGTTGKALSDASTGGGGGGSWPLNTDQTTGLKRMISAIVGVGGETATPGVLEFDMVGETTTLRITQSTDGNDRLTVEEV